jgi:hypothetical protein
MYPNVIWLVNNKLERVVKETVVAKFKEFKAGVTE